MTGSDFFNMPMDMTGANSLVTDGNPFDSNLISVSSYNFNVLSNRDHNVCGFPGPSILQADNNNLQACIDGTNSHRGCDSFTLGSVMSEREATGDFLYGTPCPMNNTQVQGRYMEGMPLSAASISTLLSTRWNPHENVEKFASAPLVNSLEVPRSVNLNSIHDASSLSSQGSMRYGREDVPFGTSTKWDYNNFVTIVEPSGKVMGGTGSQPPGSMVNVNSNGWVTSQNTSLSSDSPGSSRLSNELSLSLATSNPSVVCRTSIQDQYSGIYCSSGQHERCMDSEQLSFSRNLSLGFDSSKRFHLKNLSIGSRFVHAIQEILAEVSCYSLGNLDLTNYATGGIVEDQANVSFSSSCTVGENYSEPASDYSHDVGHRVGVQIEPMVQSWEVERKKKDLLALLQVVDDQFSQCLDEIHTVISAFHAVTELNPHIHGRFALQTVSFLYKNLRARISNHILAMGVHDNKEVPRKEEKSFETSFIQKQWALQQLRRKDNQLWRPQRGLPERSVSVLRAWMFQNFLHPYPKDAEKHLLAVKSGLTRSQVSNWFINARVRLWKPMIEEMYAEMNRRNSRQNAEETISNQRSRIRIENQRFAMF